MCQETELWAFTLALAALACALRILITPAPRWANGAAIASSMCTLTRASVGVAVTGATLVALVVAYRSSIRRLAGPALAAVAGGVVHAAVNTVRYGGPWDIPLVNQVQTNDPSRAKSFAENGNSLFGAEFVPPLCCSTSGPTLSASSGWCPSCATALPLSSSTASTSSPTPRRHR